MGKASCQKFQLVRSGLSETHLHADSSGQRVVEVGGEVQEARVSRSLSDRRRRDYCSERKTSTERLGEGEDVGDDAVSLERPKI